MSCPIPSSLKHYGFLMQDPRMGVLLYFLKKRDTY
jgi:hypothetical protein